MMAKHFPFRLPRSRLAGQTLPSGHGLLSVPAKAFLPAQRLRWRPLLLLLPSPSRQGIPAPKGRRCSFVPPSSACLACFIPSLPPSRHLSLPLRPPIPPCFPHPPTPSKSQLCKGFLALDAARRLVKASESCA